MKYTVTLAIPEIKITKLRSFPKDMRETVDGSSSICVTVEAEDVAEARRLGNLLRVISIMEVEEPF